MDYKKEYENAFAIAKDWYNDPKTTGKEKCLLEAQYPELKESEDERIRKELIRFVKGHFPDETSEQRKAYLAWLEKKGEQKPIKCYMEWYDFVRWFVKERTDNYTLIPSDTDIHTWGDIILDHAKKELENQGEQNLANSAQTCKDEQQSTDKVEPKFKVGDWLIGNNIVVKPCCITQIHEPYYYLTNENSFIKFGEEDKYRLWTIKDAKDGDVLATLDYILIFKEFLKNDGGISYCYYDFGAVNPQFIWSEDKNWYFGKEAIIHPATKEQRELLFQKMKEAGYEWDAEKKELKKIEQNPAWSEEDWDYYAAIIAKLEVTQDDALLTDNQMEFLKSLKNRVLPQPKQEWKPSDEQMEVLNWCKPLWNEPKTKAVLESLIEDLKKLRKE